MSNTIKFEANKTYQFGFIGDSELKVNVKVTRRTEKSIWIELDGKVVRKSVSIYQNTECVDPYGRYSMSPILRADKPVKDNIIEFENGSKVCLLDDSTIKHGPNF